MPPIIATLATNQSYQDLKIFLTSLSLWYTPATAPAVYIFTDSRTMDKVIADHYLLYIVFNTCLDKYSNKNRLEMEAVKRPNGKTLWYDFQMEKLNLLDWVFSADSDTATTDGVFYLDSDICFFGPLPSIPDYAKVALSPHYIKQADELRFGRYNGGFLWFRDKTAITIWREACPNSRFHEQAALECFDATEKTGLLVYDFPMEVNYGWWRMWQSSTPSHVLQNEWKSNESIIFIGDRPLQSVHTHFYNASDNATKAFNEFVISKLKGVSTLSAKTLLSVLKFE